MIFTAGGGTISGVYSGSSTYMFSDVSSSLSSSFLASMSTFSFKSLMTFSRFPSLAVAPLAAGITGSVNIEVNYYQTPTLCHFQTFSSCLKIWSCYLGR